MKNSSNIFSSLTQIFLFIIGIIFSFICLFIFISFFGNLNVNRNIIILLTIIFTLLILILKTDIISFNKINLNKTYISLALFFLCFLIKFLWVFKFQIEPSVDYETFHNLALNLAQNTYIENTRYIALFPHIFGYSFFLSNIFKLFGTGSLVAPITNVVLTCISMLLIYHISYNISGLRAAVLSALFWIVLPSQTIYNMFSLSEPLYTTLLLLAWFICLVLLRNCEHLKIYKTVFLAVVAGLALGYANATRPIAIIVIISFFLYLFVLNFNKADFKSCLKNKLIFFIVTLVVYFAFNNTFNLYIENILNQEIASVPGVTLYFGFNQGSDGGWNEEDAKALAEKSDEDMQNSLTANDTQKYMIELLKQRISSANIDYSKLMFKKFTLLLGHDSGAIFYMEDTISDSFKNTLQIFSNIFYYSIVLIALLNSIKLIFLKKFNPLFLFMLFVIGLTFAHSIAEVAPRYHYSALPAFIIVASFVFKRNSDLA